jgi:murein L,D-transpeptidase YcbB/YkuD
MILDSVVGKLLLTTDQKNRADVDGNGYVQAYDASLLMQQFGLSCLTVGSLLGSSLTANALGALNEENLQTNKAPTFVESSCGKFTKTLSKGMVNEEVKCLQKMLGEKGFKVEGIESGKETTLFGYNTLMALKKFQTSNGLTADGIFGLATREALKK